MSAAPARARASARTRILHAARRIVRRGGAGALSIGDAATEANVSKALVLYHFRDKDSLLTALVDDIGADVLRRAGAPLDASARAPLDALWAWTEFELRAGDIQALASLAACESEPARAASRRLALARRDAMAAQVGVVFGRLGLSPRMPEALVAESLLAFVDGLASRVALDAVPDPRAAYDVLWLALLTLVE